MLQVCGVQPYLKKDVTELEKNQKKVENCFHMRSVFESWDPLSFERVWLETECGRGLQDHECHRDGECKLVACCVFQEMI